MVHIQCIIIELLLGSGLGYLLLDYNTFLHIINSTLLYYNFYFIILGINITFTPLHFLGFNSMPRRIPDYPDLIMNWNFLSSCGSSLTLLGFIFLFYM